MFVARLIDLLIVVIWVVVYLGLLVYCWFVGFALCFVCDAVIA